MFFSSHLNACHPFVPYQLQAALKECLDKHRGANAALYGGLGYILLTVTAGEMFGVYALRLAGDYDVEVLVTPFSVSCSSAWRGDQDVLWLGLLTICNYAPGPRPTWEMQSPVDIHQHHTLGEDIVSPEGPPAQTNIDATGEGGAPLSFPR